MCTHSCAGGSGWDDQNLAGAIPKDIQHVAGKYPGLVHIAAAVVGPPNTSLVRFMALSTLRLACRQHLVLHSPVQRQARAAPCTVHGRQKLEGCC